MAPDTDSKNDLSSRIQISTFLDCCAGFDWSVPESVYLLNQTHSALGVEQKKSVGSIDHRVTADWHYTFEKNLSLGIRVADCTAALIRGSTDRGEFIAAIHAGWRGTALGIFQNFYDQLKPSSGFHVWLSPSICQEHFEVGEEVLEACGRKSWDFARPSRPGHYYFDLKAFQIHQLAEWDAKVISHPLCTYHQPELISYRRTQGQTSGRQVAWIKRL